MIRRRYSNPMPNKPPAGPLPPDLLGFGYLLKHARLRLDRLSAPAMAVTGLDGRETGVLAILAASEPLSQHEAAAQLGIDRTTMVALIDALTARGLAQRRQETQDRRRNLVIVTQEGRDRLKEAQAARADVERRFLKNLSDAEARELRRLLTAVAQDTDA
jgi:DNA-binding MarR family transcriptional regulator